MFNLFRKKVYCQGCKKEITEEGGYVTSDKDIYCVSERMENFQIRSMKGNFKMDYRTSKEVQGDIKEKKLIRFGKLEHIITR
jgi:hypothetical protein